MILTYRNVLGAICILMGSACGQEEPANSANAELASAACSEMDEPACRATTDRCRAVYTMTTCLRSEGCDNDSEPSFFRCEDVDSAPPERTECAALDEALCNNRADCVPQYAMPTIHCEEGASNQACQQMTFHGCSARE
jgi:hypothetical protein